MTKKVRVARVCPRINIHHGGCSNVESVAGLSKQMLPVEQSTVCKRDITVEQLPRWWGEMQMTSNLATVRVHAHDDSETNEACLKMLLWRCFCGAQKNDN